jgi:flagellar motor component MotA
MKHYLFIVGLLFLLAVVIGIAIIGKDATAQSNREALIIVCLGLIGNVISFYGAEKLDK